MNSDVIEICDSDEEDNTKNKRIQSCIVISDEEDQPPATKLPKLENNKKNGLPKPKFKPIIRLKSQPLPPTPPTIQPFQPKPISSRQTQLSPKRPQMWTKPVMKKATIKQEKTTVIKTCMKSKLNSIEDLPNRSHATGGVVVLHEDADIEVSEYYLSSEPSTAYYDDRNDSLRFRCNMCSKIFKNNILAAKHLFHHLRSDHNHVISNIKCMDCLATFSSFHKLQIHMQWHKSVSMDSPELRNMCKICEVEFIDAISLAYHLKDTHPPRDMPYKCGLCFYRTSQYAQLTEHFNTVHDGTVHVLCPYCLRVFKLHESPSTGICALNIFMSHLKKHVCSRPLFRCTRCRLFFLTSADQKRHEETDHEGKVFLKMPQSDLRLNVAGTGNTSLKQLVLQEDAMGKSCVECRHNLAASKHYPQYKLCRETPNCVYASCCRRAMILHKMAYHAAPQKPNRPRPKQGPDDRALPYYMHCHCSWYTILGNGMANHLATCSEGQRQPTAKLVERKRTPAIGNSSNLLENLEPTGIPILDAVGLMRIKKTVNESGIVPTGEPVVMLRKQVLVNDEDPDSDVEVIAEHRVRRNIGKSKWNNVRITDSVPPGLEAIMMGTGSVW